MLLEIWTVACGLHLLPVRPLHPCSKGNVTTSFKAWSFVSLIVRFTTFIFMTLGALCRRFVGSTQACLDSQTSVVKSLSTEEM